MAGGSNTVITKDRILQVVDNAVKNAQQIYEQTGVKGEQRMKQNAPVDTGELQKSSKVIQMSGGTVFGFILRSYGNEQVGRAYALYVDRGHHTVSGGWVPANPYYSQAVTDTKDDLATELTGSRLYS